MFLGDISEEPGHEEQKKGNISMWLSEVHILCIIWNLTWSMAEKRDAGFTNYV